MLDENDVGLDGGAVGDGRAGDAQEAILDDGVPALGDVQREAIDPQDEERARAERGLGAVLERDLLAEGKAPEEAPVRGDRGDVRLLPTDDGQAARGIDLTGARLLQRRE